MKKKKRKFNFDKFAWKVTRATGRPSTFIAALALIIVWAVTGPVFKFSDTWQLVINTGTTIITFLMVFIIQQTQNKDTMALQLKINELIAADRNSSNRLINIEDLSEEELEVIKKFYISLYELAQKDKETDLRKTHSYEEAAHVHKTKAERGK
ncbi:MAG TPA: low affinity iron permease family protein [Bacteroidales bacterium]|nr:low affinity iron permease family protein [Bacteroidales bacterium]